jgi:hypothetical protein
MSHGDIHTVHRDGGWYNDVEGSPRSTTDYTTKEVAVLAGRAIARSRGVEHFIHNLDGEWGERNTYPRSRDPRASRG